MIKTMRMLLFGTWEYGRLDNGLRARRHSRTGEIQFLLWPERTDETGWVRSGDGHLFIYDKQAIDGKAS